MRQKGKARSSRRVLIIERDLEFSISLTRLLSRQGYQVFAADSCESAFTYLDTLLFGIVFFNLSNPKRCNLDDLEAIVAHRQKPYVVVMSAYDEEELKQRVVHMGVRDYLTKPIKKEDLMRVITPTSPAA